MYDVKITAIRKAEYLDLSKKYENEIEHKCDVLLNQVFIAKEGNRPSNLCIEAWKSMEKFVIDLANGKGNFYDGWMRNPYSAMISCNDGFRPVSFYIERIEK